MMAEPLAKKARLGGGGDGGLHAASEPGDAQRTSAAESSISAEGAASTSGLAPPLMLRTVEDVLAALPRTPNVSSAAAPADLPPPLPLPAVNEAKPPNQPPSPAYPSKVIASTAQRCRASFSSEPPSLDLAASTVFESPALMPIGPGGAVHIPLIDDSLLGPPSTKCVLHLCYCLAA